MARRPARKHCDNCGDPVQGEGKLCADCRPDSSPPLPAARPLRAAMCSYCRGPITWENVGRLTKRSGDGQVENLYYCPSCRSTLEFASWLQEKF